jgi:hypothetical protein
VGTSRGSQTGGQIKGLLSRHVIKRTELKAALNGSTKRQKAAPQRKAPGLKKGKKFTLGSKLAVAEGGGVDEGVDE